MDATVLMAIGALFAVNTAAVLGVGAWWFFLRDPTPAKKSGVRPGAEPRLDPATGGRTPVKITDSSIRNLQTGDLIVEILPSGKTRPEGKRFRVSWKTEAEIALDDLSRTRCEDFAHRFPAEAWGILKKP